MKRQRRLRKATLFLIPRRRSTLAMAAFIMVMVAIGIYVVGRGLGAGTFHLNGWQIVDPNGAVFTPVGANVDGPHFVWGNPTLGESGSAQAVWKWNAIRLNSSLDSGSEQYPQYNAGVTPGISGINNDLDGIVNEYTGRHMVVIIDMHPRGDCGYPTSTDYAAIKTWWIDKATRYKSNPYVWFNLENEPGGGNADSAWINLANDFSSAIRGTGAQNMIVYDGSNCGQEQSYGGDWRSQSAFLLYGPSLRSSYGNVVFSAHIYGNWSGKASQLTSFIQAMHSQNLPLMIGETGWIDGDTSGDNPLLQAGTQAAFSVAPGLGVGILPWHGNGLSGFEFVSGDAPFYNVVVNGAGNPTNLDALGQLIWNYGHSLSSSTPVPTPIPIKTPTPTPTLTKTPAPTATPKPTPTPTPVITSGPSRLPTPPPTVLPIGGSGSTAGGAKPPVVSGTITVAPPATTSATHTTVLVDGQPVSATDQLNTSQLTNGRHTITVETTLPNGQKQLASRTVTVQNQLTPLQAIRNFLFAPFSGNVNLVSVSLVLLVVVLGIGAGLIIRYWAWHRHNMTM